MAAITLPCTFAASTNNKPQATCLTGHCGRLAAIAAIMCFGSPPLWGYHRRNIRSAKRPCENEVLWTCTSCKIPPEPTQYTHASEKASSFKCRGTGGMPSPPSASPAWTAAAHTHRHKHRHRHRHRHRHTHTHTHTLTHTYTSQ